MFKLNITVIVLTLLCPFFVNGQSISDDGQPRLITRFPFKQYSGGVMILKAQFEQVKDSFNFILDTGSGGISLDSTTCSDYDIELRPSDTTISGIGGRRKVSFAFDKTLHFPGLTVDSLSFHVNNYEVLTSVYGEKIDGIMGYSFFKRYIVKIDFDSMMIEVYEPGIMKYPNRGHILKPSFTSIPMQVLQIKDRKRLEHNFYFDTGAGLCFLVSEQYAADSALLKKKRKPKLTQAEGMVGRLQMRLTVIKELKLGPYRFRNVPTYLYKDDYNILSYPSIGGLFGNELLRRFNMTFNYGQREIHLLPNSHFSESFDYAYTGLGMYFLDGHIMVEDVIPGSPAEKAGFEVGDIVVAVANNMSNNIQTYKNLLLVAHQRIRVIISRNEMVRELVIKTTDIF